MKQYSFQITDKQRGSVENARATAATADIARAQIVLTYGSQFDVADFPMSDVAWLMSAAAAIEGGAA